MVMKVDRTVKLLLGIIAILLAALVLRPMLSFAPTATAQSTTSDSQVQIGYVIPQPSIIQVPKGEYVRELQVIDSAQAFLVRYDDRIEVYRVQLLNVDQSQLAARLKQLGVNQ